MGGVRKKTRIKGLWETDGGHFHARLRDKRTGKPKWVPLGKNWEAAKKKFHRYKAGDPIPSRASIADVAADWLALAVATRRNEKGQALAATWVDRYLTKFFGGNLGSIDGDSIRSYRLWLAKQKVGEEGTLSVNTVVNILSDLRAFLNWCEETGRVERSAFPRRVMPKIPDQEPLALSPGEVEAVLAVGEPHASVIRLGLGTGLRWGDLLRVEAKHLKHNPDGWYVEIVASKTGKLVQVPVTDEALVQEVRGRVGRIVAFTSKSTSSFNRVMCRRSGVANFHVHRLRHTFASRYLERRGQLAALQQILGHASIKTTERYAKLLLAHVQKDAKRTAGQPEGA